MKSWQVTVAAAVGAVWGSVLVPSVRAADVDTAPRDDDDDAPARYVEIPLDDRPLPRTPIDSSVREPGDVSADDAPAPRVEVDPEVAGLIKQLGDADFRKREAAVVRLKEIGRPALPALKQARDAGGDPEVVSRAESLIRFFENPRVPRPSAAPGLSQGGRPARGFRQGFATEMQFSIENGVTRITVKENGREVRIQHGGDQGIRMAVTGDDGAGKRVTQNYDAKTPDELKKKHPEAFELFERWTGQAAARLDRRGADVGPGFGRRMDDARGDVHDLMLRPGGGIGIARRIDPQDPVVRDEQIKRFMERMEEQQLQMRRQAEDLERRVKETERRALEGAREE